MGVIQCWNLSGKHPYGGLALLIAFTCVLVLLNKYCHFLVDLFVYFSACHCFSWQIMPEERAEVNCLSRIFGQVHQMVHLLQVSASEWLVLVMNVHYGLLSYLYLNQY